MTNISIADYDRLIHKIYHSGANSEDWSVFVDDLANLLGGSIICLQAHSVVAGQSLGVISSAADPDFLSAYERHYSATNVWAPGMLAAPIGKFITSDELCPRDEFLKTEFYNDYMRTEGITSANAVALHRSPTRCVYFSGNVRERNAEQVQAPMRRLFELLGPHICRSIEMMRVIPRSADGEDLYATAERAADAVFFIDRAGRLVHENRNASALRGQAGIVAADTGRQFHLLDRRADAMLQAALGAIRQQDYQKLQGSITIRRIDGAPRRATLVPLKHDAATMMFDRAFEERPMAMLAIPGPPALGASTPLSGYGLTQAELALALAIAEGLSPQEYADSRAISVHTVRTQLKAVFAKTGINRQSQLAPLIWLFGRESGRAE